MKKIDVFKLGCEIWFDIRGTELSEETNSLIIVDETRDFIPGFESNKVIELILDEVEQFSTDQAEDQTIILLQYKQEKYDKIFAVELGLSSDTFLADEISELENKTFVTNSDAHSLPKIAREYNKMLLEDISFKEIKKALKRIEKNI